MNPKPFPFVLLLAAAVVTGCQEAPPPSPPADAALAADSTDASVQPVVTWNDSDSPAAGTLLVIKPEQVDFCTSSRQVVEVEWDVTAADPAQFQLWTESPAGTRKLWVATKALSGSRKSGAWAMEGTKFIALDAGNKSVLNSATVAAAACP